MGNPTNPDNITNIEKLKKDVDVINQSLQRLKDDLNKSDEDKKKEAEKGIKEATDKKKEVDNELKKLEEKEGAEKDTNLKEAKTLSDTLKNIINHFQSIINKAENPQVDSSSNQLATTGEIQTKTKVEKTKDWIGEHRNKTKDWMGEQWEKIKENPGIVGAGVAVGVAIKSAWDWIFGKKKKKNNGENEDKQEDQTEEAKTDTTKDDNSRRKRLIIYLINRGEKKREK